MDKTNQKAVRSLGLTTKLLIWLLCIALLPLGIFGVISYLNTIATLRTQCLDNIITIADNKVREIEEYFHYVEEDIIAFARNPIVISIVNQYEHRDRDISKDSEEYGTRIIKLRSFLYYYSGKYGKSYDVFLINSQGDIFFTIKKEDDYGTNILTGPYKDTQLAHVFKQAALLSGPYISSFEYYPPSKRISAFMGMPIWVEGKVIGVVCVQIDAHEIKKFSANYSGLGKTGEVILGVKEGNCVSILAPLRHDSEAAFKKTITIGSKKSKPIQMAVQAREGIGSSVDYRGKEIIAVWRYLHYPGWGLVVKMDANEVFSSALRHRTWVSILGIVTFALVAIVSAFISRSISGPIIKLTQKANKIAAGELTPVVGIKTHDEIGQLAKSFNIMITNLKHSEKFIQNVFDSIQDGICVLDNNLNIIRVNKTMEKWYSHSLPLLGKKCFQAYHGKSGPCAVCPVIRTFEEGTAQREEVPLVGPEGTKGCLELHTFPLNNNGSGVIEYVRNITDRKRAEEQIKASLKEKETLLQEIHHRVKNNMQVISSLIKFQSENVKDERYAEMFKECQNRIRAMSLIHEKLYRSDDIANIKFDDYVKELANEVFRSYRKGTARIALMINIEDISIGIDTAIPCGLIVNELMSNAMKYAFPDERDGEIKISVHLLDSGEIELVFSDNGIGMPEDIDYRNTKSLGLRLIFKLTEHQLGGKVELDRSKGTEFRIRFKEAVYKKRI